MGITTVLPILRAHTGRAKLYWGLREGSLLQALESELRGVDMTVSVGRRLDVKEILEKELEVLPEDPAVVVSGPEAISNEVRAAVCEISARLGRSVTLVDEAFSW